MVHREILAPVVGLVLWTFFVWGWMYATRLPAIAAAKLKLDPSAPRGEQMATLPPRVRWKADNYNHLMEMPTLFYAVCIVLSLVSIAPATDAMLGWAYVGLRVVHSLVQSLVNVIEVRFVCFVLSSFVLLAMAIRAATVLV